MTPGRRRGYLKPWVFGVAAGTLFVGFEALLGFYPPPAYAFCLTCHTRDLVNGVLNAVFRLHLETAAIAERALMATSPAVLAGAYLAARLHREFRPAGSPRRGTFAREISSLERARPLLHALAGAGVMLAGIAAFGCPTRLTIRAAYGDVYGLGALAGMFAGIFCGTLVMKLRARAAGFGGARRDARSEAVERPRDCIPREGGTG